MVVVNQKQLSHVIIIIMLFHIRIRIREAEEDYTGATNQNTC